MTIILLQFAHNLHFAVFYAIFSDKMKTKTVTFPAYLVYTLSFRLFFIGAKLEIYAFYLQESP